VWLPALLAVVGTVAAVRLLPINVFAPSPQGREELAQVIEVSYQEGRMADLAVAADRYVESFGDDPRVGELRDQAKVEAALRPVSNLLRKEKWEAARETVAQLGDGSSAGAWGPLVVSVYQQFVPLSQFVHEHGAVLGPDPFAPGAMNMKSMAQIAAEAAAAPREHWLPFEPLADATRAAERAHELCAAQESITNRCSLLVYVYSHVQARLPQLHAQLSAEQPTQEQWAQAAQLHEQHRYEEEIELLERVCERWPDETRFRERLDEARAAQEKTEAATTR
jgi:hypothetical protein